MVKDFLSLRVEKEILLKNSVLSWTYTLQASFISSNQSLFLV